MNDPLSAPAIAHALGAGLRSLRLGPDIPPLGTRLEIHEAIGSTNDRADALGLAGAPEGCAVFAETQTSGRGRGGNRWTAPPGKNLTFSLLLRPDWPVTLWPRFAHAAGLAVARAAQAWSDRVPVQLKWPNDVYAMDRKLAGILLELKGSRTSPHLIVGIGINVNSLPDEFPPDLDHTITSLRALNRGNPVDRNQLAGAILAELTALYARSANDFPQILEEVASRSLLLGRRIRFSQQGRWREGKLIGFGENGEMQIELADSPRAETIPAAETIRLVDEFP
jgi:BirA family biotin operon repressor/biotin-[acetyl-CoA-carboxylase] ligase